MFQSPPFRGGVLGAWRSSRVTPKLELFQSPPFRGGVLGMGTPSISTALKFIGFQSPPFRGGVLGRPLARGRRRRRLRRFNPLLFGAACSARKDSLPNDPAGNRFQSPPFRGGVLGPGVDHDVPAGGQRGFNPLLFGAACSAVNYDSLTTGLRFMFQSPPFRGGVLGDDRPWPGAPRARCGFNPLLFGAACSAPHTLSRRAGSCCAFQSPPFRGGVLGTAQPPMTCPSAPFVSIPSFSGRRARPGRADPAGAADRHAVSIPSFSGRRARHHWPRPRQFVDFSGFQSPPFRGGVLGSR